MHFARQNDLKIQNGDTVNETGQGQSSSPPEATFREASVVQPRMLEWLYATPLCINHIKTPNEHPKTGTRSSLLAYRCRMALHSIDLLNKPRQNVTRKAFQSPTKIFEPIVSRSSTMAQTKAFHDTQETAAQPGIILLVPPGQGQIQPGESPGPSGQAENLEEWWKKDTKEAAVATTSISEKRTALTIATFQRHNIDGEKLAAKEGGPSTVDDLFEKTCLQMAAEEAEEAENADPAENVGSEFYSRDGSVCVIQLYTRTNTAVILITFQGQAVNIPTCKFPFVWHSAITSPKNPQLTCPVANNHTMAPKKTNLKAGKAGKSKSSRNVSSETKSRNAVRLTFYRPMPRRDLDEHI
ncbi:hypothetical protein FCIRC_5176 [Fusarium circinatum]|uniref:Uncharacterized protein n=1 Tax=Fusarium circinatum TaxID=48490 RepID=A0A8H5X4I0_FUSCI|nr:hypothetical protein FCIRC_5176 [Fusarium circinatum]